MNPSVEVHLSASTFYARLKAHADEVERRYRYLTPTSARLFEDARHVLPGGSTRHGVFRLPYPLYVEKAEGSRLIDVDGRELVDFCLNATALPLGHSHPRVVAAVAAQVGRGTALFSPTRIEIDLAAEICRRLPSAQRVFFVNSGGEAVMMALRVARAYTGRHLVAKFEGAFHGNHDDVLWSVSPPASEAGPPDAPRIVPASDGLLSPEARTVILPYNNTAAALRLIENHALRLAAVIVEPLANRMGLVEADGGFLKAVCDTCRQLGVLTVFDEILCFRVGYHGMQGRLDMSPDLTTLGKLIGGGFPVGAVAGRAEILEVARPQVVNGRVYHTGTFAANPVTLSAGKATLDVLTPAVFDELNQKGEWLRGELRRICAGLPLQVTGLGSLFKVSPTPCELVNYRSTLTIDARWQELASQALINEGFFLNPQLSGCIATTTTQSQMDGFLRAIELIVHEA